MVNVVILVMEEFMKSFLMIDLAHRTLANMCYKRFECMVQFPVTCRD